jgi:hypothetical protein
MEHKLTGRIRFRSNWRGKLILQVECSTADPPLEMSGVGQIVNIPTHYWRDGKAIDLNPAIGGE